MRVTLLGSAKAGKTSLASAFVNNFCPTVHTPTSAAALYYKILEIKDKREDKKGSEDPFPVLAEIEDTMPFKHPDMPDHLKTREVWDCPHCKAANFALRESCCRCGWTQKVQPGLVLAQGSELLLGRATSVPVPQRALSSTQRAVSTPNGKLMRAESKERRGSKTPATLAPTGFDTFFEKCEAPDGNSFRPASHRRMAFLLAFDAGEDASLDEAKLAARTVLEKLSEEGGQQQQSRPVVFLVATKTEGAETQKNIQDNIQSAQQFAAEKHIYCEQVSPLELQKVRRLFRKVLEKVQAKEELWTVKDTRSTWPGSPVSWTGSSKEQTGTPVGRRGSSKEQTGTPVGRRSSKEKTLLSVQEETKTDSCSVQ